MVGNAKTIKLEDGSLINPSKKKGYWLGEYDSIWVEVNLVDEETEKVVERIGFIESIADILWQLT